MQRASPCRLGLGLEQQCHQLHLRMHVHVHALVWHVTCVSCLYGELPGGAVVACTVVLWWRRDSFTLACMCMTCA